VKWYERGRSRSSAGVPFSAEFDTDVDGSVGLMFRIEIKGELC
jgi:hypothetical protein